MAVHVDKTVQTVIHSVRLHMPRDVTVEFEPLPDRPGECRMNTFVRGNLRDRAVTTLTDVRDFARALLTMTGGTDA